MVEIHSGDLADRIDRSERHPRTRRNFRMQYRLSKHTLIPWLEQLRALPARASVCEIGCGEGGVIAAFAEYGCAYTLGTDIEGALLDQVSRPLLSELGLSVEVTTHDVIGDAIPEQWKERFDVVVLRDVIEHLHDPAAAMKAIRRIMKPSATLMLTFPPYTSPFGGHQQLLGTPLGKVPFIHLLPTRLFDRVIRSGDIVNQEEVRRLHKIRCSVQSVITAARDVGLQVLSERYFGLRPVFRWKYNMPIPTMEITALRRLPCVASLAMEAALVFTVAPTTEQ